MKRRSYSGKNNPKWKGGKIKRKDGRVLIYKPKHPFAFLMGGKYILEYRLILEKKIGRYLHPMEVVHHIDGDITNNEPWNLKVMWQKEHAKLHQCKRDKKTGRFLKKKV